MLEGDLTDFPLPDVLRLLAATSKSGQLTVRADDHHGRIELLDGRVRDASTGDGGNRLARRLIGRGRLDAATLRELAEGGALPNDRGLAAELVARSTVAADEAAALLGEQVLDTVFDLLVVTTGRFRFEAAVVSPDALATTWSIPELLDQMSVRLEARRVLAELEGHATADLPPAPVPAGDGASTAPDPAPLATDPSLPREPAPAAAPGPRPAAATSQPGHPARGGLRASVDEGLIEQLIDGIEARA